MTCITRSCAAPAWWRWLCAFAAFLCLAATAAAPAPDRATAGYEIDFMEDMIDHHAMAMHTATLCEQRAVHDELRALCTSIKASQSQEIASMQSWLRSWYGDPYEPQMAPSHMRAMEKLSALHGADFEIAFMEMMIKHHAKAVKEATACLERAHHRELLDLCQRIVETQAAEIRQMRAWLCDWYAMCGKSAPAAARARS